MHRFRKPVAFALAAAALLLVAAHAGAIHDGVADGNAHPHVGAMLIQAEGQWIVWCSGTLIAPTVYLTAAHCAPDLAEVGVSFASEFVAGMQPDAVGTFHAHPSFGNLNAPDIAVVVLTTAIDGLPLGALPTAGLLDELAAQNGLKDQPFVVVGYGADDRVVGGGPPQFRFDDVRRNAVATYQALNPNFLRLHANPATGNAGACIGDSGGPNFLGDGNVIAGLTLGGDGACQAMYYAYRLDTPEARDFLGLFVTLP